MMPARLAVLQQFAVGQNHRPIDNFAPENAKLPRHTAE